jgi:metallo-beta-lactamase family protein
MTRATQDLTDLSLQDSAKIAEENTKVGQPKLYGAEDVLNVISQFEIFDYDQNFKIGEFEVTPRDAGHILGSASLEIVGQDGFVIAFSGDLGNSPQDLIQKTRPIGYADVIVMESTYGDKTHPKENPKVKIKSEIVEIEKSGGTLLVPCFSLERTQEILHITSFKI